MIKTWIAYSFKNTKIISLVIILEFLTIWIECINSILRLFKTSYGLSSFQANDFIFSNLNSFNCLSYIQEIALGGLHSISQCTATSCSFSNFPILFSIFIIFLLLTFHHCYSFLIFNDFKINDLSHSSEWKISNILDILNFITINIIDFMFKILGIFIFFICFNKIFVGLYFNTDYIFIGILCIFLSFFVSCYLYQVNYVILFLPVDNKESLHYDFFSKNYDILLLILKILITLNKNLILINTNNKCTALILFFDYCIVLTVLYFSLKNLLTIFYDKNLILVTNFNLNLLRSLLIIHISMCLIIYSFFNFMNNLEEFILHIVILLISIFLFAYINKKLYSLIYDDEKVFYQLIYLMTIYIKTEDKLEFDNESEKIKSIHLRLCPGKEHNMNFKCELCKYYKNLSLPSEYEDNHTNDHIKKIKLIGIMIEYIHNNILHSLSEDEKDIFNIIDILYSYSLFKVDGNISVVKVVYLIKSMMQKNRIKQNCFYYNLEYYFLQLNKQKENSLKKFSVFKKYDISLNYLKLSVEILSDIICTLESKVNKDLYPKTCELYSHKEKIIENLTGINENEKVFKDTFSFVMCRYIFENAFNFEITDNLKSLNSSNDLDSNIELISDNYKKDSIMVINYNVDQDILIITRSSKPFSSYRNNIFEEIFPSKYRSLGRAKFIQALNSCDDNFSFDYLANTKSDFVTYLKLQCRIYRSFDLKEIFIFATFSINKDETCVFETPIYTEINTDLKYFDIKQSILCSISEKLERVLFVNPILLSFLSMLNIKKKYISFTDIFKYNSPNLCAKIGSDGKYSNISEEIELSLNYSYFYKSFFKEIDDLLEFSTENEDMKRKIYLIEKLASKKITISLHVCELFRIYKNENVSYLVFNIKAKNKIINDENSGLRYFNFLNSLVKSKQFVYSLVSNTKRSKRYTKKNPDDDFNFLNGIVDATQMSEQESKHEISEFDKKKENQHQAKGSQNMSKSSNTPNILPEIKGDLKSSASSLTYYKKMTLFVNLGLIIYCLIFMVLGLMGKNKITQLNEILYLFNDFERMFYQTSLSLFYNVGVLKENAIDSNLENNQYWNKFRSLDLSISMGDYANRELSVKAGLLNSKFSEMLQYIYTSNYKETTHEILSFITNYKSITFLNSEINLLNQNMPFMESILNFINSAKSVNFPSMSTMIYIFNYDVITGNYNFNSVKNKSFYEVQKFAYEMIINFTNFLNNLNKIGKQLTQLFNDEINTIFSLNFSLSLIFILLHLLLLIISLYVIYYLKRNTYKSNCILSKLITGDWSIYLNSKLIILKDMLYFYKINPRECSNKIKKNQNKVLKALQKQKEEMGNFNSSIDNPYETSNANFNAKICLTNPISDLLNIIIYLFSFFLIYSLCLILIFQNTQKDIEMCQNYKNSYLKVDKGIMNSIMLLQLISVSNQTDYNLLQFLSNYHNFENDPLNENGFIMNLLEENKINSLYLSKLEKSHSTFENMNINSDVYSNCEYLYNNINDDIFETTKKFYNENELSLNLIKLCKYYPIMQRKNFKNIIEEISYISMKLLKQYDFSYGKYDRVKELNDNNEFYDEFTLNLLVLRPLQSHIINTQLNTIVTNIDNNFSTVILAFMIGNILLECIIFFVINRKLIAKALFINEEISCLTLCITA